jgi:hypothetical protein
VIAGNLFTRDYLLEGITLSEPWTALTDATVSTLKAGFLRRVQNLQAVSKANEAQTEKMLIYRLTPEEIQLMWRTAPPRMPFTPAGLAADISGAAANQRSDEDAA